MTTKLIRYQTSDKIYITGLLFTPAMETKKIFINIHGGTSNFFRQIYIDDMAEKLTSEGYAFMTFDNRGANIEYKFYKDNNGMPTDYAMIGFRSEKFDECLLDIDAAIAFAKENGFNEINLLAHSYGCNKAVWYAMQKNFEGKLVLLAPCDVVGMGFPGMGIEITNQDLFRYRSGEPVPCGEKLRNDILVEIGLQDKYITHPNGMGECINYLKGSFKNANVEGHLLENCNHNYDGCYRQLAEHVAEWLKRKH